MDRKPLETGRRRKSGAGRKVFQGGWKGRGKKMQDADDAKPKSGDLNKMQGGKTT